MEPEQSVVPTLQILSGPLAGRLFKVDRDLIIIGRNPAECDLVLEPKSVSRKHAAIVRKGRGHAIKDLGSTRGTIVSGRRITGPVVLPNGAVIQLGDAQLLFSSQPIQIHESDQSTVFASVDLTTPSGRSLESVKPEAKLKALQQISQAIGSTLVLGEILDRVLACLFEIFPRAERGFVVLQDRKRRILTPEAIRTKSQPSGELRVSKSILKLVLDDGQAILSKDLAAEFPNSDSVNQSQIRSLICVPILDQKQRPMGMLQIDTKDGRGRFEQEDLDLLVSVAHQISVAVQNAQLHEELLKQNELEQDLNHAREVMQALLPERPRDVSGYVFWDCYEPARHVGGDYFGFIPLFESAAEHQGPPRRWAIAVGDVVGKGMPAALLTARLSAEIRLFLQGEFDPARVLHRLNRQFTENGVLDMYITFLLVVLDLSSHRLTIANAGHHYPLIRRRDGRVLQLGVDVSGFPLSITPEAVYESIEVTLEPGESVLLYTDGVPDALSPADERFGETRIRELMERGPADPAAMGEALIQAVHDHMAGRNPFDDLTLVAFGRA